jgi:hypothetical protein
MSIPIGLKWYDAEGNLLSERRCFTISYGSNIGDLSLLSRRLQECSVDEHKKFVHPDIKYVVAHSAPDYMFDIYDLNAILPNKFKQIFP